MHCLVASSLSLEQALCFYLPLPQLFLVCVVLPMLLSFCGLLVFRKIVPPEFLNQSHDFTGPVFNTLGTVYGIFLAFIVSTTWQAFSNTQTNLVQEARDLGNLYFATQAFSQPKQGELQQLLRNYRDSVVIGEWKTMERGEANPETETLLRRIASAYMQYKPTNASENSVLFESFQTLAKMTGLRDSRIDDSSSGLLPALWFVLLTGAVVTVACTYLFGAHDFAVQVVMTMLLTGVISMSFFTIINLDYPFTGTTIVSSLPLSNLDMK